MPTLEKWFSSGIFSFFYGGHFLKSKFWEKIFSTNCSAHIAKNPQGPEGRGFRGGVGGEYLVGIYEKAPGKEWNFPRWGRVLAPLNRADDSTHPLSCLQRFLTRLFSKRVTGFEFYPYFGGQSVPTALGWHFLPLSTSNFGACICPYPSFAQVKSSPAFNSPFLFNSSDWQRPGVIPKDFLAGHWLVRGNDMVLPIISEHIELRVFLVHTPLYSPTP